ncbi:choline transporter-like 2 isoform X2 [Paramacrobiotus metropolitanus]|uniref:choline transporter-like 2 isoform X2 n=1 Tax=Paramacrobiotus metropolitanus TaxID=2943436 RepID=UPI0024456885|nr:choline transporter-like 2 isoform X2 [Paramacrobiotus metropolitanus]
MEESPSYTVTQVMPASLFDDNQKPNDLLFTLKEQKQPLIGVGTNDPKKSDDSNSKKQVKTQNIQVQPDDLGIQIGKQQHFPALGTPRPFDPNFIGPVKLRRLTDPIVLGIFGACLIAWLAIIGYALANGDIKRLMNPADSLGFVCGLDLMESMPFLFYFDLTQCVGVAALITGCLTTAVCVPMCPNSSFSFMELSTSSDDLDTSRLICSYEVNKTNIRDFRDVTALVTSQQCAAYYFPSGAIGGRCFPGLGMYNNGTFFNIFDTKIPRIPPVFVTVNSNTTSTSPTTPTNTTSATTLSSAAATVTTTVTHTTSNLTSSTAASTDTTTVDASGRGLNVTGLDNKTITADDAHNGSRWLMEYMKTEAFMANITKDLAGTSWIILLFCFVGALFCFTWVLAMRWLALWLVWFAMATISALMLYGVYYCFSTYGLIMEAFEKAEGKSVTGLTNYFDLTLYLTNQDFWLTLGLLLCGMIVLLFLANACHSQSHPDRRGAHARSIQLALSSPQSSSRLPPLSWRRDFWRWEST